MVMKLDYLSIILIFSVKVFRTICKNIFFLFLKTTFVNNDLFSIILHIYIIILKKNSQKIGENN